MESRNFLGGGKTLEEKSRKIIGPQKISFKTKITRLFYAKLVRARSKLTAGYGL